MHKPSARPNPPPRRAPAVVVSGRGKLMVRGDVNIIEHQTVVQDAPQRAQHTPWRTVVTAAIIAHCTHPLGDAEYYRAFIHERFGKATLGELTDAELQRVQRYVFNARAG